MKKENKINEKTLFPIREEKEIKTKWNNRKVPACKIGKNHRWKGSLETGICLKCGYDVFDSCYKEVDIKE